MNIGQIKLLSWATTGTLTLGLSYYIFDYVRTMEIRHAMPDGAKAKLVLEDIEQIKVKTDDVVGYPDIKRLFHVTCSDCTSNLNWTGKEKVVEKPVENAAPTEAPKVRVADVLSIVMVKADTRDPRQSAVYLRYKTSSRVQGAPPMGVLVKVGEHLMPPLNKIRLDEVVPEGGWFVFEGEDRERELLGPARFDVSNFVVEVGPEGVRLPPTTLVPRAKLEAFNPNRTARLGSNAFQIGLEDARYFEENYQEIFARDVRTVRYQDPKTGRYAGIQITSVTPGSIASQHGAQEGDVIKSINGHPVTSTQEAIHFVKSNANKYSTWEVVVENKGQSRTVTYHSPNK
jgi:hypothetical protein